jgi:hypothetical protein
MQIPNEELMLACIDKNDRLIFLINQPGNTKCREEEKKSEKEKFMNIALEKKQRHFFN